MRPADAATGEMERFLHEPTRHSDLPTKKSPPSRGKAKSGSRALPCLLPSRLYCRYRSRTGSCPRLADLSPTGASPPVRNRDCSLTVPRRSSSVYESRVEASTKEMADRPGPNRRPGRAKVWPLCIAKRKGSLTDGGIAMPVVEVEQHGAYAVVTINRPEVLNALNREVLQALEAAWDRLERADGMKSVVVTGAGERAFVAGADIREIQGLDGPLAAESFSRFGQAIFNRIAESPLLSIMAINGFALGGGLELAMAGDFRLLADDAEVGQPEILLGIIPGFGGTQRLKDLVGEGRALWLIASGTRIGAAQALAWGIVDEVTPRASLRSRAEELARLLGDRPPLALRAAKRAVRMAGPRPDRLAAEAAAFGLVACSEDAREGTTAFLEKRPPVFRGR